MGWKEHLDNIYFDLNNPISYAGPEKIYKYLKKKKKKEGKYKIGIHAIRRFLQDIDAYSLQRPLRYKFKTRKVISQGIDALWDVDLADVSNLEKENDGIRYLFIPIDVFSRHLWVVPLKNKQHQSIIDGFKHIFGQGRKPQEVRSDPGSEWKNRWVKQYLDKEGVGHYVTHNVTHANYAERVIRTLKVLMYCYFTHNRTHHYLDVLQDIVHNYNARPHSVLDGKSPDGIEKSNEALVWKHLYVDSKKPRIVKKKKSSKPFKFKVGDVVRISANRRTFQRDFEQKWTEEVFTIKTRYLRQGIPIYKIIDYDGDSIAGTFYNSELQKVNKGRDDLFKVERVLKRRKRNGIQEVYVKWLGYPKKFNSWIKESDVQNL
ncbi:uncharacterized protein LOC117316238 [Pecten maximus]|uniref:uncharacterized protein LOC117316238 n=1 Tax=Pecten maximus TaxID=6579 RepID=UPI00145911E3|nr:uncharacterized protein LOC117316238 [Pecten maximus]